MIAVGRHGSVHAASRALGISQPALSRLISSSEKALGVELFARSRSGTRLNRVGEHAIKEAVFALHALSSVSEVARDRLPIVRLGCIPRVMHVLIPHLLAELSDTHAGLRLQVTVGTSSELANELESGRVDFVIARRTAAGSGDHTQLETESLYSERTVVVCGRDNRTVGTAICHVRDLVRLPWLLPKRGFHSRDVIDMIVSTVGLPPLVPVIESSSFESNLSVVAATKFLALAPEFAARRFEKLKLVRIVRMKPSLGASPVMLQYFPRQRLHPTFEPFRTIVTKSARKVRLPE